MSVNIEKLEHNMAKLTIEVPAEEFEKAVQAAYLKNRSQITIPGFRKGKAPRQFIEKIYGEGVFFEEAANSLIPGAYEAAVKESGEEIMSSPDIDITQIGKDQNFIFTAVAALKPEVTLGKYKGVEVDKIDVTVSDEEVEAEIDRERENNARIIDVDDRPVQDGDQIKLDFDGSIDGVPFEGGKAEDYPLTIGSGSFIPGFEEQLIGAEIDEDIDVKVTFPEDYHAEDLAGKVAVFACKVKAIQVKELPEADDDFAQDVSEFDTLDEYKEDIRKNLTAKKEEEAKSARQNQAVEEAAKAAEIDIPEVMITEEARRMAEDFAQRLQSQGLQLEQYLQIMGMDVNAFLEQMKKDAEPRLRSSLVLEAIAKAEGLEVTQERIEEEFRKMADMYSLEVEKIKELMGEAGEKQMKDDLQIQMAVELVGDNAVEVEKKEETEAEDAGEEA